MKHSETTLVFAFYAFLLVVSGSLGGCGLALDEGDRLQRAQEYEDLGDYRAAIVELKFVLQDNPGSVEGRTMLGRVSLAAGDAVGAESELMRAVDLGAPTDTVGALLAQARLEQGKFQAVLDQLARVPDGADTLVLRGNANLGIGNASAARSAFSSAMTFDPVPTEALLGMARVELADGNKAAAIELVGRAKAAAPNNYDVRLLAGRIAFYEDKIDDAEADLVSAIGAAQAKQNKDQEFSARLALAELYLDKKRIDMASGESDILLRLAPKHPIANFFRGRVDLAKGNVDSAESHLLVVLNQLPNHLPTKLMLGSINLSQGEPEQAEMYLNSVMASDPDNQMARMMLASSRAQQGKAESVLNVLEPVLEGQTADSRVLGMMGAAALQTGDISKGIGFLEQGLAGDPGNREISLRLARAYLSEGQNDKAIDVLNGLAAGADPKLLRETLLVTAFLQNNDPASGRQVVDSLLKREPRLAAAWNLAATFYRVSGDDTKAREYFERGSEMEPENLVSMYGLARMDLTAGDNVGSRKYLERILKVDPQNVRAMMSLAEVSIKLGESESALSWLNKARDSSSDAVEPRILLGRYRLQSGQLERADEVSLEAIKLAPSNADALMLRGAVLMAQGKARQATEYFQKAVGVEPKSSEIHFQVGAASLMMGETGASRKALNRALELDSGHFRAAALLARLDMSEGDVGAALSRMSKMQALYPENPAPFAFEGDLRMMQKDYSAAASAYDKAWQATPSLALANRIMVARDRAGLPDYNKPLEAWVRSHPEDLAAQLALGQAYQGQGLNSAAMAVFQGVLDDSPGNALALNNLAWLYYLESDPRALETAEKAYKAAPKVGSITDTLGWILFKQGHAERAEKVLRDAVLQEPKNLDIQYHLAAVLIANGKPGEARNILVRAVDLDGPFATRSEAEALLKSL